MELMRSGEVYEEAKSLAKKINNWFHIDMDAINKSIIEAYDMGVEDAREHIAREIETYMDNYSDEYSNSIRRVLVSIARGKK